MPCRAILRGRVPPPQRLSGRLVFAGGGVVGRLAQRHRLHCRPCPPTVAPGRQSLSVVAARSGVVNSYNHCNLNDYGLVSCIKYAIFVLLINQ